MKISIKRTVKTNKSTIGELSINGKFVCYTLEDKDRGLKKSDSLLSLKARKLFGETAIPSGTYDLIVSYSNRFKKYMPEIKDVPAYSGIRIHSGNKPDDSLGCILVGDEKAVDFVGKSRLAFDRLMAIIEPKSRTEKITIEIL